MPPKLSDLEIQRALGSLPGWARRGDVLTKTFTFPAFADGIELYVASLTVTNGSPSRAADSKIFGSAAAVLAQESGAL